MVLKKEITQQIKNLLQKNPQGLSITDIVKEVNINRNTAGRYLENLLVSGQVAIHRLGMAKIYTLSQRVPLSAVLSISSELVIQLDSSLRIVFANEPFLKLIGTDSKNLQGKNIEFTPVALIFDELFPDFLEHIRAGLAGQEWSGEIEIALKNVILFCKIAPTAFDDGRKGVSVILEDITKRKQTEIALRENERRLMLSLEVSQMGTWDLDLVHHTAERSLKHDQIFGFESLLPEWTYEIFLDHVVPEDRTSVDRTFRDAIKNKEVWNFECRIRRKDGIRRWILARGEGEYDADGIPVRMIGIVQDITERKQLVEILQKSEEQYRSLVETTGTGYVIIDNKGRVITANQEYLRLTGRSTLAEVVGKPVTDWTASYDIERNVQKIDECLVQGQIRGLEIDYQRMDGTIQPIEVNASVIHAGSDQIILTLCRDITQRKQAELKVRESERQFRLLAENSVDMIGRIAPDYTHIYASPAYTTTLGYLQKELIGKDGRLFIHPDDVHIIEAVRSVLTEQNPSATVSFRSKHKDGHFLWVESHVRAIFDETTHELSEYYAVTRDITKRKKAEDARAESEDRYRKLVEISPDAVFLHRDGKIIYANPATFALLGASRSDEVIGKNVLDFVSPDFRDIVRTNIQKDLEGRESPSVELNMVRVDGVPIITEGKGIATEIDGKPAVQVAIRDITEQKKAEMALRESEAISRALINAPTDSVILADSKGIILALNETAALRFGKPINELIGVLGDDLLPKELARSRRSLISRVLETKEMVRFEDEHDNRWFDTVAYPVLSETGDVSKVAIIARDITEQHYTVKQLHESEQRFQHLLELSFDSLVVHKNNKIAFLNENAAKILGAAFPQNIIGRSILDFVHPDSRRDVEERVRIMSNGPGTVVPVIAEKFLRVDGTIVPVEVMAISFNDNGIPAVQVAFREIASQEGQ